MYKMTTKERMTRMFQHKEADRIPIFDSPWAGTISRWHQEGLPAGMSYVDYFELDKIAHISADNSPQYEARILDENDDYKIYTTNWGATQKEFKHEDSTPEFIDFKITSAEKWLDAKKRMIPDKSRIPWDYLKNNYQKWVDEGYWRIGGLWFGFDVTHSWAVGTETLLVALIEEPDWCSEMFNHYLDIHIALLDMIWDAGYRFDSVMWYDDMGFKHSQFFSVNKYREVLKPVHKRAIDWAHNKGIKAHLHSCGDINPFVPELIDIGLDALNPLEVKAGVNPVEIKKKYGDKLVLHGGINAVLWEDLYAILEEIRATVPVLKESGGYIFASDHSIPNSVSLENFRQIIGLVKELGRY